jgi:hypothetical protein
MRNILDNIKSEKLPVEIFRWKKEAIVPVFFVGKYSSVYLPTVSANVSETTSSIELSEKEVHHTCLRNLAQF